MSVQTRHPVIPFIVLTIVILSLLPITGCGQHVTTDDSPSDLKHFFANAERRDPEGNEADAIVRFAGCTGFFVRNTADKILVMTAQHCLGKAPEAAVVEDWCKSATTVTDAKTGTVGKCQSVVAAHDGFDLTLLEMSFGKDFKPAASLRLASSVPAAKTNLKMIGYPADKFRERKLTVTENCWITDVEAKSPHKNWIDQSVRHNCTTYGGNSGGPMLVAGTDIAAGLPFSYRPKNYTEYEVDDYRNSAYMAVTKEFIERHQSELDKAGVVTTSDLTEK